MTSSLQIIILGMHRSGTSAITGALSRMGIFVGDEGDLTGRNWQNPQGFFERRDARRICDALLHSSGADWWKVSAFETGNVDPATAREQSKEIQNLVNTLDASGRTWALKEPRLCLLLPLFRSALTRPIAIHAFRHPAEVAQSLRRRNGFPVRVGLALWEVYNVAALRHGLKLKHAFLDYEELTENPRATLYDLARTLSRAGAAGLDLDAGVASINPSLRRERRGRNEALSILSPAQKQLWHLLKSGRVDRVPRLSEEALEVLREFEFDEAERNRIRTDLSEARARIDTLSRELAREIEAFERERAKFKEETKGAYKRLEKERTHRLALKADLNRLQKMTDTRIARERAERLALKSELKRLRQEHARTVDARIRRALASFGLRPAVKAQDAAPSVKGRRAPEASASAASDQPAPCSAADRPRDEPAGIRAFPAASGANASRDPAAMPNSANEVGLGQIIVYSCQFGNCQDIKEPVRFDPAVRYIMFTDGILPEDSVWKAARLPYGLSSARRTSGLPKVLPHRFLPSHDVSVYVDGSLTLRVADVGAMVSACLNGAEAALYPHYLRDCVYEEIDACRELGIEDEWLCDTFAELYRGLGVPPGAGLFESTMIVRRDTPAVRAMNERWWDLYVGERDQLCLMAAIKETGANVILMPIGRQVLENDDFVELSKHEREPVNFTRPRAFVFIAYAPREYNGDLGSTYNYYMSLIDDEDIAVFLDHDAMFCDADWLELIERVFRNNPHSDLMLTAMTNRIGKPYQRTGLLENEHRFSDHADLTRAIRAEMRDRMYDVTWMTSSSGVVMAMRKRTWRKSPFEGGFLKVDNKQHLSIRAIGGRVLLVPGLYVYHFYRADGDDTHAVRSEFSETGVCPSPVAGVTVKNFVFDPTQGLDVDRYMPLVDWGEWAAFLRNGAIHCDKHWYHRLCDVASAEDGSRIVAFGNQMTTPGAPDGDDILAHRAFSARLLDERKRIEAIDPADAGPHHFAGFLIKRDLYDRLSGVGRATLPDLVRAATNGGCSLARLDSVYVYAPLAQAGPEAAAVPARQAFPEHAPPDGGEAATRISRFITALAARRHVAILTLGFWPNQAGMEMMIHNLALELTRGGDLVTLYTPKPAGPFDEIPHTYLLRRYENEEQLEKMFAREQGSIPFDVLLVQGAYKAATLARRLAEPNGIPVVLRTHGEDIQTDPETLYGYRLDPAKSAVIEDNVRAVDHNVVIGSHVVEEIRGIDASAPVSVIHNGVDTDRFAVEVPRALHERLGLAADAKIILTVGRNVRKKSFHHAVDALARIAAERADVVLVHVGKQGDGEDLRARAEAAGVSDRFHALGEIDYFSMPEMYASADIFMFTSKVETFGNVTVEAMAAGLPCVEFDYVVNRDKIDHGVNGFVVPYGDVEALAARALALIADPEQRASFGLAARRAVQERFSWPSVARKYRAAFDEARRTRADREHRHAVAAARERVRAASAPRPAKTGKTARTTVNP